MAQAAASEATAYVGCEHKSYFDNEHTVHTLALVNYVYAHHFFSFRSFTSIRFECHTRQSLFECMCVWSTSQRLRLVAVFPCCVPTSCAMHDNSVDHLHTQCSHSMFGQFHSALALHFNWHRFEVGDRMEEKCVNERGRKIAPTQRQRYMLEQEKLLL